MCVVDASTSNMSVGLQGLAALTPFCLVLFCFCSEWLHLQLYRLSLSAIVFLYSAVQASGFSDNFIFSCVQFS
jgi:hypothetical protein